MVKRKTKKQSYIARKRNHISKKIRSRLFKHRRTHKKKTKVKAKGVLNRIFRRRSTLRGHRRQQQQIARQQKILQREEIKKKDILKKTVETLISEHPEGTGKHSTGLTKFKHWANINKKTKLQRRNKSLTLEEHIDKEIIEQFDTDRGRLNYVINGEIKPLGIDVTHDEAIDSIKRSQKNTSAPLNYLLFWGTQSSINFIRNYIQSIVQKDSEEIFVKARIPYNAEKKKNNMNTCIHYENESITIIYDFLISYPLEPGIECSVKIVINSPFKLNNIVELSISKNVNQCAKLEAAELPVHHNTYWKKKKNIQDYF